MLMALLGFLGGFLPKLLGMTQSWMDNKHELDMFKLQISAQEQMHRDKLETMNVQADILDNIQVHQPIASYGVPFLDKMHDTGISQWFMLPLLYVYTALDFLQIFVRPGITLALTAFYMVVKYAMFQQIATVYAGDEWYKAVLAVFTDYDKDLVTLVLSYWFGSKIASGTGFSNRPIGGFK